MPSSKTQTTSSNKKTRQQRIFSVLGLTREDMETTQKVFKSFETRSDMIKSLDKEHHKMDAYEYKAHLTNVLNAFSAFGNSDQDLLESIAGSITLHCEQKAKELRDERN
jgi:hypothetical protein